MTNLVDFPRLSTPLDKLAQPSEPVGKKNSRSIRKLAIENGLKPYLKRAKAKWITQGQVQALVELDSPLKKSYISTFYCSEQLHQVGNKITSKYCKQRWCIVCCRIMAAKNQNQYQPLLDKMVDPRFVTLTKKAVKADQLYTSVRHSLRVLRLILQALQKRGVKASGLRKLECTYSMEHDTYHAHFHIIVDGLYEAELIRASWLDRYPEADARWQSILKADQGSMKELFKYVTKQMTGDKFIAPAQDVIYRCLRNLRSLQPFGSLMSACKEVDDADEELEPVEMQLEAQEVEGVDAGPEGERFWRWDGEDWLDMATGEPLTGFVPSKKLLSMRDSILT